MKNKRIIASIVEILIGIVLTVCSVCNILDEFWSGMGIAILIVGVLQVIRIIRYNTDAEYKDTVNVAANDERNKFLSMKAWSWAGYLFVMIAAVSTIILKIAGYEDYMMLASGCVCLILILYWVSYCILRKKY